jgi:hypothetical protein
MLHRALGSLPDDVGELFEATFELKVKKSGPSGSDTNCDIGVIEDDAPVGGGSRSLDCACAIRGTFPVCREELHPGYGPLRERVKSGRALPGRLKVSAVRGDVRQMHQARENAGALFQVASQFNLLEMVSPTATPEDGVTRYQHDRTQGPACAIAAGAATIYRNYFAPVGGGHGQTAERQLDGLADLAAALSSDLAWRRRSCGPANSGGSIFLGCGLYGSEEGGRGTSRCLRLRGAGIL